VLWDNTSARRSEYAFSSALDSAGWLWDIEVIFHFALFIWFSRFLGCIANWRSGRGIKWWHHLAENKYKPIWAQQWFS
jgi:hypothetical protein